MIPYRCQKLTAVNSNIKIWIIHNFIHYFGTKSYLIKEFYSIKKGKEKNKTYFIISALRSSNKIAPHSRSTMRHVINSITALRTKASESLIIKGNFSAISSCICPDTTYCQPFGLLIIVYGFNFKQL